MLGVSAGFMGIPGSLGLQRGHKGDKNGLSPPRISSWQRYSTRKQADGSTRYTAIVRMRSGKAIVTRRTGLSRTVPRRSAGPSTAKCSSKTSPRSCQVKQGAPTLAALIRWYIETFETISKWQRSKQAHLEFLERHAIGKVNALELTAAALDRPRALASSGRRGTRDGRE